MNADVFWILIPSLLIGLLAWVVASTRSVRLATLQAETRKALIDKIGSKEDLQTYIDHGVIRQFLQGHGSDAVGKAIESIRTGVILFIAGIAMGIWSAIDSRCPIGICLIVTALGTGFLAAGFATRHLAYQWGLVDRNRIAGQDPDER